MESVSSIRKLAFALLDTDEGITEKAWIILRNLLTIQGEDNRDIFNIVESTDGRYYIFRE